MTGRRMLATQLSDALGYKTDEMVQYAALPQDKLTGFFNQASLHNKIEKFVTVPAVAVTVLSAVTGIAFSDVTAVTDITHAGVFGGAMAVFAAHFADRRPSIKREIHQTATERLTRHNQAHQIRPAIPA